jgi:hypothetical protein
MNWMEIGLGLATALAVLIVVVAISVRPSKKINREQSSGSPDRAYEPPRDDGGGHPV